MAFEAIALLTNEAKQRVAEMWETGKSYKVKYFEVSSGGHDESDPTIALSIDPADTEIPGGTAIFGPEPINSVTIDNIFCPTFNCVIDTGELVGEISSIALIAEIVYSPTPGDPDVGVQFLFAVHNRPLLVLTPSDSAEFNISVFM